MKYKSYLKNESGASVDYQDGNSINKIYKNARNEYGKGWILVIRDAENGEIVKEVALRG